MNKEEMKAKFEKNVEYLKRNIPPDDIYIFAEQTFMATLFFISKWSDWIDLKEEMERDPVVKKWINNIIGLQACRDEERDITLDLDMDCLEEEEE